MYFSNYWQLVKQQQQQQIPRKPGDCPNTHIPLSSADSPDPMDIVLFLIRECHVDNCVRYTQPTENTEKDVFFLIYELRSEIKHLRRDFDCCNSSP